MFELNPVDWGLPWYAYLLFLLILIFVVRSNRTGYLYFLRNYRPFRQEWMEITGEWEKSAEKLGLNYSNIGFLRWFFGGFSYFDMMIFGQIDEFDVRLEIRSYAIPSLSGGQERSKTTLTVQFPEKLEQESLPDSSWGGMRGQRDELKEISRSFVEIFVKEDRINIDWNGIETNADILQSNILKSIEIARGIISASQD